VSSYLSTIECDVQRPPDFDTSLPVHSLYKILFHIVKFLPNGINGEMTYLDMVGKVEYTKT